MYIHTYTHELKHENVQHAHGSARKPKERASERGREANSGHPLSLALVVFAFAQFCSLAHIYKETAIQTTCVRMNVCV